MSSELKNAWIRDYETLSAGAESYLPKGVQDEAFRRFSEASFPNSKNEDWKYTRLDSMLGIPFQPAPDMDPDTLHSQIVYKYGFNDLKRVMLVFVNGRFSRAHSLNAEREDGVIICSLKEAAQKHRKLFETHFGQHCRNGNDIFSSMNSAFSRDGAFVYVPRGLQLREPVHLMYLSTDEKTPYYQNPRNLIVMEEGSEATVIETYDGLDQNVYLTNSGTEIYAAASSRLRYHKIQLESMKAYHFSSTTAIVERDANVLSTLISFGGRMNRNSVDAVLKGSGAHADLYGLYMGKDDQHFDNRTLVHHAAANNTSNQVYKGILDGKSRGIFNGQIQVDRDAQKINAFQLNRSLLLSPEARADSKPQLKIFADDVKCSHGATIGQLDENALFYLRTRGIGEDVAKSMLTYAFASDVVDSVIVGSVRFYLYNALLNRLGKGWEQL